jgi:hypothetical protein
VIDEHGAAGTVRDTFGVGTRPPAVRFSGPPWKQTAFATDPDGDAIAALAWDLDGDRDFDDATGPAAVPLLGRHEVGLMATDAGGDIGISYATVFGAPPVTDPDLDPRRLPVPVPAPSAPLLVKAKVATVKLAALRSRGLPVTVECMRACHSTIVATVDAATARRLKLGSKREIGRGAGKGPAITVKVNAKARKALAKARSVRFTLRIATTVVGPGRPIVSTRIVTIRR